VATATNLPLRRRRTLSRLHLRQRDPQNTVNLRAYQVTFSHESRPASLLAGLVDAAFAIPLRQPSCTKYARVVQTRSTMSVSISSAGRSNRYYLPLASEIHSRNTLPPITGIILPCEETSTKTRCGMLSSSSQGFRDSRDDARGPSSMENSSHIRLPAKISG